MSGIEGVHDDERARIEEHRRRDPGTKRITTRDERVHHRCADGEASCAHRRVSYRGSSQQLKREGDQDLKQQRGVGGVSRAIKGGEPPLETTVASR